MKKSNRYGTRALWALLLQAMLLCLAACGSSPGHEEQAQESLLASYRQTYGQQVYWAEEEPDQPQVGDIRLDSMELLGQTDLGEDPAALYALTKSIYGQQDGILQWMTMEPGLEVLFWSGEEELPRVFTPNFQTEGLTPEQIICQTVWGLLDPEVALWREGHARPIGIGTEVSHIMDPADGQESIQVLGAGYSGPIYREGDWYEIHAWPDLTVSCYHSAVEDRCSANHIACENPDLATPRGIHVGSSRGEVRAAYPEAHNGPYWDWQGDYLCYQPWVGEFGPAILFVFQAEGQRYDHVQAIFLVNREKSR